MEVSNVLNVNYFLISYVNSRKWSNLKLKNIKKAILQGFKKLVNEKEDIFIWYFILINTKNHGIFMNESNI